MVALVVVTFTACWCGADGPPKPPMPAAEPPVERPEAPAEEPATP